MLNAVLDRTFAGELKPTNGIGLMDFEQGWKHIGLREGGFVNHRNDKGGATNWGITMGTYSRWQNRPVSVAEVEKMSKETAKEIYRIFYWRPLDLDEVKHAGAGIAIFDQAVNRGLGFGKTVQRLVGVNPDGHFGKKTLAAINARPGGEIVEIIARNAEAKYRAIVAADPSQMVFLKGWLNRASHLRGLKTLA